MEWRCTSAVATRAALLAGVAVTSVPAAAQPAPSARPQGGQVVAGSAQISRNAGISQFGGEGMSQGVKRFARERSFGGLDREGINPGSAHQSDELGR